MLTDDEPSHCALHASKEAGVVDFNNPRCQMPGSACKQRALFKETGHEQPSRCAVHKEDGMEKVSGTSHSVRFVNDLRRVWHFISGEKGLNGEVSDDDNEVEMIEQLAAPEDKTTEQMAAPEDVTSDVSEDNKKLLASSVITAVKLYANGDSLDGVFPHQRPSHHLSQRPA